MAQTTIAPLSTPTADLCIDNCVGHLSVFLGRLFMRSMNDALAPLGITCGQLPILCRLWEEDGLPMCQLASRAFLDPPPVTSVVRRLEASGLLRRERDGRDGRVVRIWLTPAGRALKERVAGVALAVSQQALQGFSEQELEGYRTVARKIITNLMQG